MYIQPTIRREDKAGYTLEQLRRRVPKATRPRAKRNAYTRAPSFIRMVYELCKLITLTLTLILAPNRYSAVYDALWSWAFTLNTLLKSGKHTVASLSYPAANTPSTSVEVFKTLLSTSFAGASGPVSFDATTGDRSMLRLKVAQVVWVNGAGAGFRDIAHFNVADGKFEPGAKWAEVAWPHDVERGTQAHNASGATPPGDRSSNKAGT